MKILEKKSENPQPTLQQQADAVLSLLRELRELLKQKGGKHYV